MSLLERALAGLEAGALEVRLPDGSVHHFGSGDPVAMEIQSNRFFHRVATAGHDRPGRVLYGGEWEADDLPALIALLLRNARARPRTPPSPRKAVELASSSQQDARACSGRVATSATTTTSGTTSSG